MERLQRVLVELRRLVAEAALQEEVAELVDERVEVELVPQLAGVAVVADDGHREPQFTCFLSRRRRSSRSMSTSSSGRRSGATKPRSSLRPIFFWAQSPSSTNSPAAACSESEAPGSTPSGRQVLEHVRHAPQLRQHVGRRRALADPERPALLEEAHHLLQVGGAEVGREHLAHRLADQLARHVLGAHQLALVLELELAGERRQRRVDVGDARHHLVLARDAARGARRCSPRSRAR